MSHSWDFKPWQWSWHIKMAEWIFTNFWYYIVGMVWYKFKKCVAYARFSLRESLIETQSSFGLYWELRSLKACDIGSRETWHMYEARALKLELKWSQAIGGALNSQSIDYVKAASQWTYLCVACSRVTSSRDFELTTGKVVLTSNRDSQLIFLISRALQGPSKH